MSGEQLKLLQSYRDTGLTPSEIQNLKAIKDMQADTIKTFATELCKEKNKVDYWEREAKKWCAKLGEIRMLAGGDEYGQKP